MLHDMCNLRATKQRHKRCFVAPLFTWRDGRYRRCRQSLSIIGGDSLGELSINSIVRRLQLRPDRDLWAGAAKVDDRRLAAQANRLSAQFSPPEAQQTTGGGDAVCSFRLSSSGQKRSEAPCGCSARQLPAHATHDKSISGCRGVCLYD